MKFTKMHGLGNDFILVDAITEQIKEDYSHLSRKICDRHFGIGADGLILVLPSEKEDIKMRIFNPDGSEPEMCGNGLRCFAKFVYEKGIVSKKIMTVETLAGTMIPELILDNNKVINIKVDMGQPILERSLIPMLGNSGQVIEETIIVEGKEFKVTAVSMGNPHCIIFVPDINEIDIYKWGPLVESHELFPNKTNVEFVQIINEEKVIMRVWERGAGITNACGTGACATLVAANLSGKTSKKAEVQLLGGSLYIEWLLNGHVLMTGSATNVFQGEYL
ncbi:diaminopimelate epimerase [Desulfonispora thiosulfatigenes DSM 11270]|uniref:Diaminopimelate epimerase n=1 Tax=Desulfonispora thiosulfatigenes DSM 11270 TaxID=656914 RepID=A0A1W1VJB3_DESTI|nr:diaminopimelate epimerase [Desulfonispora thiosulfatigenes]SMB93320.1 diaminopimelate epimerase [Desulfonispora thiosulfatigenes DSM 11270]